MAVVVVDRLLQVSRAFQASGSCQSECSIASDLPTHSRKIV